MNSIPRSMPPSPGIYAIVNSCNQHRYVGSAVNLLKRQQHHLRDLATHKHKNSHLQRAYNSYGPDAFYFVVLELVDHSRDLLNREQHHIDTLNPEYNIARTAGSNLGMSFTDEHKARISAKRRTNPNTAIQMAKLNTDRTGKHLSSEHRAKISVNQKGRKLSAETRAKMSAAHKGQKKTAEHAAKISKGKKGHEVSEETRAKIAASKRGGKHTQETKEKMSAAKLGKQRPPEVGAKVSATKRAKKLARTSAFQLKLF